MYAIQNFNYDFLFNALPNKCNFYCDVETNIPFSKYHKTRYLTLEPHFDALAVAIVVRNIEIMAGLLRYYAKHDLFKESK